MGWARWKGRRKWCVQFVEVCVIFCVFLMCFTWVSTEYFLQFFILNNICTQGLWYFFCHVWGKFYKTWHLFQTLARVSATKSATLTGISCLCYMQAWRVWRAYLFCQMDLQICQSHRCCYCWLTRRLNSPYIKTWKSNLGTFFRGVISLIQMQMN